MAVVNVNFYSNSLMREIVFKAILPTEGKSAKEIKSFKTLYLLHGIMGNYNDWVTKTRIVQLAIKYNIAVVMPSGDNSFYIDQEAAKNNYGELIGRELVEETRKLFPLSTKREDTFIAGLSMGGYGAIRNGLKYHQTFGALAGLSSALIMDYILVSTEDADWAFKRRSYYEATFGDLSHLQGSDKDVEALVKNVQINNNAAMPKIFLACGTEDYLIENNRKYRDFLIKENVPHTYMESSGIHNWSFWDEYIEKVLEWLVAN